MVDVTKLLTELGIEYKSAGANNVKVKCINPNHEETKPSMYIHKETGIVHCFGCHLTGNLFSLLGAKGIHGMDAFKLLKNFSKGGLDEDSIKRSLFDFVSSRGKAIQYTNGEVRLPEHYKMPTSNYYIQSRGITEEDIDKWKIGFITEQKYYGWVLIPIYQFSVLKNYFMRSPWGSGKLYGYYIDASGNTVGYSRNDLLPGIDFACNFDKKLYISEGIFDAISVSHTKQQSVASLSNNLLPNQLEILKNYSQIVLVPDNDSAGYALVKSALPLIHSTKVSVCKLPSHRKDAGESTLEEILESMYHEIPIEDFVVDYVKNSCIN